MKKLVLLLAAALLFGACARTVEEPVDNTAALIDQAVERALVAQAPAQTMAPAAPAPAYAERFWKSYGLLQAERFSEMSLVDSLKNVFTNPFGSSHADTVSCVAMIEGLAQGSEIWLNRNCCECSESGPRPEIGMRLPTPRPEEEVDSRPNINNFTDNRDHSTPTWNLILGTAPTAPATPATAPTQPEDTAKRNFPQTNIWGGAFGGRSLGGYYAGIEIGPAEIEYRGATAGQRLRDSILRTQYANVSGRVALVNQPNLRVSAGATGTQLYQRELITTTSSFEDFVDGRRFAGTDTLPGIVGKSAYYAGPSVSGRASFGRISLHGDIDYQLRAGGTAEGPNGFLNGHARVGFEPFPGATLEAGAGYQFNTLVATGGINLDLNQIFTKKD